MAYLTCINNM